MIFIYGGQLFKSCGKQNVVILSVLVSLMQTHSLSLSLSHMHTHTHTQSKKIIHLWLRPLLAIWVLFFCKICVMMGDVHKHDCCFFRAGSSAISIVGKLMVIYVNLKTWNCKMKGYVCMYCMYCMFLYTYVWMFIFVFYIYVLLLFIMA